ncbi:MAG: hypothetical protein M3R02_14170 [Chloroflexota bacterium]|nr:hypothetical protein [Chloroflexota bacterium]
MLDQRQGLSVATECVETLPKTPTLCIQWVRCGKPGCRCARGELHGPYHYLFWRENGRLRKRYVRSELVADVVTACAARRNRDFWWRNLVQMDQKVWRALVTTLREAERRG